MSIRVRKGSGRHGWWPAVRRLGHERIALIGLVGLHVILGVYYSMAIPIWEAHDEIGHYYFVRYLATEHNLPPPGLTLAEHNDELHQPPLYYMLAALPVSLVDAGEDIAIRYNPHMYRAQAQGGFNRVVHDPVAEAWPYRGPALGVHVARLASVLLGSLGLLFTYLAGRRLFPDEPWVRWGAALVLVFWPQYRFTTAVVNNDIMVTVCVAAATWLLARLVTSVDARPLDILGLGVATGLAPLSKGNGLALIPPVLVVAVGCAAGAGRERAGRFLGWLAGSLALAMAVVGWWYAHNLSIGVEMLGGRRSLGWLGRLLAPLLNPARLHWAVTAPALRQGMQSLWAGFGWNNLGLPLPLLWMASAFALLGLAGVAVWLWRRPGPRQAAGVVAAGLVAAGVMLAPVLTDLSSGRVSAQGRYLLAGLPPLSLVLARGWTALLPAARRSLGWATVGSAMGLLALIIPVVWIRPAYALPRPLSEAQLAGYTPLQVTYGGFAELVGIHLGEQFVDPGEPVRLSLVWRARQPADADYTVAVQLFTGERQLLGEVHRFPGRGLLATSTWEPGYLFAEEVSIPVTAKRRDGPLAWLEVSLYDHRSLAAVPAQDGQGNLLGASVRLERVRIKSASSPGSHVTASTLRFGESIGLVRCEAEAQCVGGVSWMDVDLQWAAQERLGRDYTISLQLRDDHDAIVAQADSPPRQGELPTSYWLPGELIADRHTLFLPAALDAGEYHLYVCLYDSHTGERLPVRGPRGEAPANREAALLRVTAEARAGHAPVLRTEAQLPNLPATPVDVQEAVNRGRAAVEAAVVNGLKATDRELAAGRRDEALRWLQERVLALDPSSLPGLFREMQAEEASGGDAALAAAIREQLGMFELKSVAVPEDPRLGLYLGDVMTSLVDEGVWTRDALQRVASYQVWRFSEGRAAAAMGRVMEALLLHYPGDAELLFLEAERWQRQGDLEEAEAAYGRVLAVDAGHAQALLRLGTLAEAQGRPEEARHWYEQYRHMVPADLIGLKKLSTVLTTLGAPGATALQEELAANNDDRRLVAELLGVPVDAVGLGPNLVENGSFEEWRGTQPWCWEWSPMFSYEPFGAAAFAGAADGLLASEGQHAARVDGLWSLPDGGKSTPRAGFWYADSLPEGTSPITVRIDAPYVFSMDYRTHAVQDGSPAVWLSREAGALWRTDHALPSTNGAWTHFAAVAWNRAAVDAAVQPLLRSWAVGTVEFDNLQLRPVRLSAGMMAPPGEARFHEPGVGSN